MKETDRRKIFECFSAKEEKIYCIYKLQIAGLFVPSWPDSLTSCSLLLGYFPIKITTVISAAMVKPTIIKIQRKYRP